MVTSNSTLFNSEVKLVQKIKSVIRDVQDFPKAGIVFKDITPLLHDPQLCEEIVDAFYHHYRDMKIDALIAVESRGFFFGSLIANRLNIPFIPARKKGKLPYRTISTSYELEYGKAEIEIHEDAIKKDWNVLIHDDLLATGGTAKATARLAEMFSANIVGFSFLVELSFLNGRKQIQEQVDFPVHSIISY